MGKIYKRKDMQGYQIVFYDRGKRYREHYMHSSRGHKKEAVDLLDLHKNSQKSPFKLP